MDTFLMLGDIILQGLEVPQSINFGGEQMLRTHKMIGGKRIVDAMGRDDSDIQWEGYFTGADAQYRARYFDAKRASGEVLTFSYFGFRYKIIIKSFSANIERFYRIPYSISLQIIEDLTLPINFIIPTNFDDLITGAMIKANDLGLAINNGGISAALAILNTAVNLVPSFNNATAGEISSVLSALGSAQSAVSGVINSTSRRLFQ